MTDSTAQQLPSAQAERLASQTLADQVMYKTYERLRCRFWDDLAPIIADRTNRSGYNAYNVRDHVRAHHYAKKKEVCFAEYMLYQEPVPKKPGGWYNEPVLNISAVRSKQVIELYKEWYESVWDQVKDAVKRETMEEWDVDWLMNGYDQIDSLLFAQYEEDDAAKVEIVEIPANEEALLFDQRIQQRQQFSESTRNQPARKGKNREGIAHVYGEYIAAGIFGGVWGKGKNREGIARVHGEGTAADIFGGVSSHEQPDE